MQTFIGNTFPAGSRNRNEASSVLQIAKFNKALRNIAKSHTHTHIHIHICIYIYMYAYTLVMQD